MERSLYAWSAALVLVLGWPPMLNAADPPPWNLAFFQSEQPWGDGKSEVADYEGSLVRYGTPREGSTLRLITVRETFAADTPVKTDDWRAPGAYNVLKQNQITHIPTGTYAYDQMWSGFWATANGWLVKFSLASIDSCGNTYKEGVVRDGVLHYRALTYWEGMTDVTRKVNLPVGGLFYNELPLKLRGLAWEKLKRGITYSFPLAGSVVNSKADTITFAPAILSMVPQKVELPLPNGGRPRGQTDAYAVTVEHAGGRDRLVFQAEAPHVLLQWQRADGGEVRLTNVVRIPYWQLNQPGDEKALQGGTTAISRPGT